MQYTFKYIIYNDNYKHITRCTRGDARSFFRTHKMYLYTQNEISYEYIQILFKKLY